MTETERKLQSIFDRLDQQETAILALCSQQESLREYLETCARSE